MLPTPTQPEIAPRNAEREVIVFPVSSTASFLRKILKDSLKYLTLTKFNLNVKKIAPKIIQKIKNGNLLCGMKKRTSANNTFPVMSAAPEIISVMIDILIINYN